MEGSEVCKSTKIVEYKWASILTWSIFKGYFENKYFFNLKGGAGVRVDQLLHHIHHILRAQPFTRGEARIGEKWERRQWEEFGKKFCWDSAHWRTAFWGEGAFAFSLPVVSSHTGEDDYATCTKVWCLEKIRIPPPRDLSLSVRVILKALQTDSTIPTPLRISINSHELRAFDKGFFPGLEL